MTPKAIVLILDRCTCKECGSVYETPVPQLMLKLTDGLHYELHKYSGAADIPGLACEISHHNTTCEACPNCFTEREPLSQLELFAAFMPKPEHLLGFAHNTNNSDSDKATVSAVPATPLSAFVALPAKKLEASPT